MMEGLRLKTLGGEADERKAADLVRGLARRIIVLPREEDEPQGIEIEAGSSLIGVNTDCDCNIDGCGGPQPIKHFVRVLPSNPNFLWSKAA